MVSLSENKFRKPFLSISLSLSTPVYSLLPDFVAPHDTFARPRARVGGRKIALVFAKCGNEEQCRFEIGVSVTHESSDSLETNRERYLPALADDSSCGLVITLLLLAARDIIPSNPAARCALFFDISLRVRRRRMLISLEIYARDAYIRGDVVAAAAKPQGGNTCPAYYSADINIGDVNIAPTIGKLLYGVFLRGRGTRRRSSHRGARRSLN